MSVLRLIAWDEDLARRRAQLLRDAGFEVDASPLDHHRLVGQFRDATPAAVVIDLDRLPSHGRELAIALRQSPATRRIPIVFVGGPPEKVERVRAELPDASFADWNGAARALRQALGRPPAEPVRPTAHMHRYAGSPLARKLGLKAGLSVAIVRAPEDFVERLGGLEGVEIHLQISRRTRLAIWFVRSLRELGTIVEQAAVQLEAGSSIWIVYPKQAGRYKVDFNQTDVRAAAQAAGLVDYKVCAVDRDWSGLKFARKKTRP